MVDKFSQIEWTLFDSRGTKVAGPSTDGVVTGAPQELKIKVDSPTNKDKTNVRFFYPSGGKFQWSTGSTGKADSANYNPEYYCDDILNGGPGSWIGWQSNGRNGFERQFDCIFRGWSGQNGGTI
ncbi:hypothetical protein IFR05_001553 [Cadophora sp. M221]|nr:hypothetical protein IFR05_001553 [Cadophora sp. M221]